MMPAKDTKALVAEVLCELHWPEGAARELANSSHVITYVKGSHLFNAGEPADLLYVLVSGEVKICYSVAEGGRLLVDIARARQALGYLHLPSSGGGEATQSFSAEALSNCTVALVTRARVTAVARRLPLEATAAMVRELNAEWGRLAERALRYLTLDVRGRLRLAIEDISARFGIPDARGTLIPLRLSHEDFGELIGASRPMVSKHLKALADAGVFFKAEGRYVLARPKPRHASSRPGRVAAPLEADARSAPPLRTGPLGVIRGKGGIHAVERKETAQKRFGS